MKKLWPGLILSLLFISIAPRGFADEAKPHTRLELVSETDSAKPGVPIWVAIRMETDKGWHTYWKNPGDSGMPTRVSWRLFQGTSAGPLHWPVPQRFGKAPEVSYGYEGESVLLAKLSVPADFKGDKMTVFADVKWMECSDICVPQKTSLKLVLPVSKDAPRPDLASANLFLRARLHLPVKPDNYNFKVSANPEKIKLAVLPMLKLTKEVTDLWFYPEKSGIVEASAPQAFVPTTGGWILHIPRSSVSKDDLLELKGVLTIRKKVGPTYQDEALEIQLPL